MSRPIYRPRELDGHFIDGEQKMMRQRQYLQAIWVLLLAVLLLGAVATPAAAASSKQAKVAASTSINATIYVTNGTLDPIFQSSIDAQAPGAFNSAINGMVSKLPPQDQGWAMQMANTLIQPSVTLVSLKPQQGGLAATIQLHLYNGDPQPISASMLISFSVANSSTVQVTAKPLNGSPCAGERASCELQDSLWSVELD